MPTIALSAVAAIAQAVAAIQGGAGLSQTLNHLVGEHPAYFLLVPELVVGAGALIVFLLSTFLRPERDDTSMEPGRARLISLGVGLAGVAFLGWAEFPGPERGWVYWAFVGGFFALLTMIDAAWQRRNWRLAGAWAVGLFGLFLGAVRTPWQGSVVDLGGWTAPAALVLILAGYLANNRLIPARFRFAAGSALLFAFLLAPWGGSPALDPGETVLYVSLVFPMALTWILLRFVSQRHWIPAMALTFQIISIATTFTIIHLTSRFFTWQLGQYWGGMETFDPFSIFWEMCIDLIAILAILMAWNHPKIRENRGEFFALLMLAAMALMFMVASSDLLAIYVMTEFSSICLYLMVGFAKGDRRSPEAITKYFLVGMLSGILILFSGALFYGLTGSTNLYDLNWILSNATVDRGVLSIALALMAAGMGYKIAVAPFHQWFPDAVEGSPAPVGAFVSLAPKIAGFCVWMRIYLLGLAPIAAEWRLHLIILAALSMTVGNLSALRQTNVKRLLAYSSIAHVGFVVMAIVAVGFAPTKDILLTDAFAAGQFYLFCYIFMNAGAFAVVSYLEARGVEPTLAGFRGLRAREPALALVMVIFLVSLAGVPPLAGFWAKLVVFMRAIPAAIGAAGHTASPEMLALVVIAGVNTVVAAYYYFRLAREMVFPDPKDQVAPSALAPRRAPAANSLALLFALAISFFGNILMFPVWEVTKNYSSVQGVYELATRMNILYIGHETPFS